MLFLVSINTYAQLPANVGFEDGSFNGWICASGNVDASGVLHLGSTGPVPTRHTLFSRDNNIGVLDPYGKFPVLSPNGSRFCMRLGNDDVNAQAESISYTFKVPDNANTTPYVVTFDYAVVLQNPDHEAYQQPRFVAHIYDVDDGVFVPCPAFDFIASAALPGFKLSDVKPANSKEGDLSTIYYKDWSVVTINLHGYAGKLMRLEFATQDCTKGGHFGYAYLDIDEGLSTGPVTGNLFCDPKKDVLLGGPRGFAGYQWFNADLTESLGTNQFLDIFPAPPEGTRYAVVIAPYPGQGCPDTLYTTVSKINDGLTLKAVDTLYGCPETGVSLTGPEVTAGSSPGFKLNYFTDVSETTHVRDSTKVVLSGNYYIRGTTKDGCPHTVMVYVKLTAPLINVKAPEPVHYPETIDITKTFVKQPDITYTFYKDAQATIPLVNYTAINKTGDYFIKAKSTLGCQIIFSITATVLPPLPYVVSIPNVFTPNNDGVNDFLSAHLEGFVQFNSIKIYNRYGQLMRIATSPLDIWDGAVNGKPVPAGTYYWLFDGEDTYYHTKVIKSGSVSIIR